MQLSSKERKYRGKIIAENHLKKNEQRYLDKYVRSEMLTYKKIYLSHRLIRGMLVRYSISKLSNALKDVGASCVQASSVFQKLKESLASFNIL